MYNDWNHEISDKRNNLPGMGGTQLPVITQRATRSSGYWTDILISIKCPEGTNETEYIMSLAARANEIQHRAWKLQYYNTLPFIEK